MAAPDTVYTSSGDTKRTLHESRFCRNLLNANKIVEKPASVFPPGYLDKCELCCGDSDE